MFNVSLADRLKAAVNTLEQTGSSLQARAIGQGQGQPGQTPQSPTTSTTSLARSISPGNANVSTAQTDASSSTDAAALATSPTRNYSTSQLAENALSGLRKSFHFGRDGTGHARTASSPSGGASTNPNTGAGNGQQQELKDITSPTQNAGPSSRPSSPAPVSARLLGTLGSGSGSNFSLGSDTPSVNGTPRPRSPIPARSPRLKQLLPPSDPSDPATYPLPPSPSLAPIQTQLLSPAPVSVSPSAFVDPLGASPSLLPLAPPDPPALGIQSPTPDIEKTLEEAESVPRDAANGKAIEGGGTAKAVAGPTEMDNEVVKKVEEAAQRYEDMSLRYASLVTQIDSANKVIKELTPLEGGIQDLEALEGWVRMQNGKVDMGSEELKRLQSKLALQESRIEELRDTHRLEGSSQAELVTKLRSQLSTAEQNLASKATELMQLGQMRAELTKAQTQAKEEEEKRTKAISLLKTVRQKLVKAEKDREEVERDRAEERAERSRAVEELERIKAEREREVNNLRKGFERELSGVKERYEKELQAKKAAWELEMITTKASHARELSSRMTQVAGLEAIVQELNLSKQQQFETLESRQSEVDNARAQMEAMQNSTKELEFQLRESTERCSLLEDQLNSASGSNSNAQSDARGRLTAGARSARDTPSPSPSRQNSYNSTSAGEVQRLLAEAEARAEAKMSDLRHKIRSLENERNDAEEEWANKLQERARESEKLRRAIAEKDSEYNDVLRTSREKEERIGEAEELRKGLERELNALRTKVEEAKGDMSTSADAERSARDEITNLQAQISSLNAQLEDAKNLSTQLRQTNRTLREEMRKVQSSVQLMERSRNPGVGYWSSIANSGPSTSAVPTPRSGVTSPGTESMMGTPTKESSRRSMESIDTRASPAPSTATSDAAKPKPVADEEEVNLEYLRNVILQFLENKEMRPNLVRVLSVILRFTPQELRRLNAKLLT